MPKVIVWIVSEEKFEGEGRIGMFGADVARVLVWTTLGVGERKAVLGCETDIEAIMLTMRTKSAYQSSNFGFYLVCSRLLSGLISWFWTRIKYS